MNLVPLEKHSFKSSKHPDCTNFSIVGDDYSTLKVNQVVYDDKNDCYSLNDLNMLKRHGMDPYTREPLESMRFKFNVLDATADYTLQQSIDHLSQVQNRFSQKLYQLQRSKLEYYDPNWSILDTMVNNPINKYFNLNLLKQASNNKISEFVILLNKWFLDNQINLRIQKNLIKSELAKVLIESINYIGNHHSDLSETFKFVIAENFRLEE